MIDYTHASNSIYLTYNDAIDITSSRAASKNATRMGGKCECIRVIKGIYSDDLMNYTSLVDDTQ